MNASSLTGQILVTFRNTSHHHDDTGCADRCCLINDAAVLSNFARYAAGSVSLTHALVQSEATHI